MEDAKNAIEALLAGGDASGLIAAVDADLARRKAMPQSPADLGIRVSNGKFKRPKHVDFINKKLVDLAHGRIKRMILTVPPRHGKSTLGSQYLPAWYLGTFPDRSVILASYGADFAKKWGKKAKDILEEHGKKIFGVTVSDSSSAQDNWQIANRDGGMRTAGVGGTVTGLGADLLIVDDVHKNFEEAMSARNRQKVWDWWLSTAYTRLSPTGVVLIIMTRWHTDDLVGRLIGADESNEPDADDEEGRDEEWHVVDLPALAEDGDVLGREKGEALWPEQWPARRLARKRTKLGPYLFSALYQQSPAPESGEVFKREWFRYYKRSGDIYLLYGKDGSQKYTVPVNKCTRIATMDVALSEEQTADYTVIQVWDVTPGYEMILVEQWRDRKQSPTVIEYAASMMRRLKVESLGVEKDGVGLGIFQGLKSKSVSVRPLKAKGSKKMRAMVSAQARVQAGMVYFEQGEELYVPGLEKEMLNFPVGHDDQVDALSHACQWVQILGGGPRTGDDDNYDKELDAELSADSTSAIRHGERIPAESTLGKLSDEAREWLKGGTPAWMRAGRN